MKTRILRLAFYNGHWNFQLTGHEVGREGNSEYFLKIVKDFVKWRKMIEKSVNDTNKEREENGITRCHENQKRMGFYHRVEGDVLTAVGS